MPQHLEAEANMTTLLEQDAEIKRIIDAEAERQKRKIVLIASENYASRAVMEAQGSILTNKYAEGYPGKRYYGGCEFVDQAETLAIERAKELFGGRARQCPAPCRGPGQHGRLFLPSRAGGHGHGTASGPRGTPNSRKPRKLLRTLLQLRLLWSRSRYRAN